MKRSLYSLLLFIMLAAFVASCVPSSLPTPAVPPTDAVAPVVPTSTVQPTPTASPPTATVVPTLLPNSACVLTAEQQSRLDASARKFLADTDAEALQVARELDYIGINGQPSTMCGPLSVAILQDAGLADPHFERKYFYLLNPRPGFGDGFVESFFPSYRYNKVVEERVIKEVDYTAEPLCPGDFLYLFAGESGSYDHMLVVTRVDEFGRAYTVTNIDWGKGFRVEELMLYDPAQPGVGMFTNWTSRPHPQVGRTGYDGFWLWRLKDPIPDPAPATVELTDSINAIIDQVGGEWHVQLKEVGGEVLFSRLADSPVFPGSVNYLSNAVLFLNLLEKKGVGDLSNYLRENGTNSRSFDQLLRAMVVDGDASAAASIENWISQSTQPNLGIQNLGYENTFISPLQSTAAELSRMLEEVYIGNLLNEESTAYLHNILAEPAPSTDTLAGVIRSRLPEETGLISIRGAPAAFPPVVSNLAQLEFNGKSYSLTFIVLPVSPNTSLNAIPIEDAIEKISLFFVDYLQSK